MYALICSLLIGLSVAPDTKPNTATKPKVRRSTVELTSEQQRRLHGQRDQGHGKTQHHHTQSRQHSINPHSSIPLPHRAQNNPLRTPGSRDPLLFEDPDASPEQGLVRVQELTRQRYYWETEHSHGATSELYSGEQSSSQSRSTSKQGTRGKGDSPTLDFSKVFLPVLTPPQPYEPSQTTIVRPKQKSTRPLSLFDLSQTSKQATRSRQRLLSLSGLCDYVRNQQKSKRQHKSGKNRLQGSAFRLYQKLQPKVQVSLQKYQNVDRSGSHQGARKLSEYAQDNDKTGLSTDQSTRSLKPFISTPLREQKLEGSFQHQQQPKAQQKSPSNQGENVQPTKIVSAAKRKIGRMREQRITRQIKQLQKKAAQESATDLQVQQILRKAFSLEQSSKLKLVQTKPPVSATEIQLLKSQYKSNKDLDSSPRSSRLTLTVSRGSRPDPKTTKSLIPKMSKYQSSLQKQLAQCTFPSSLSKRSQTLPRNYKQTKINSVCQECHLSLLGYHRYKIKLHSQTNNRQDNVANLMVTQVERNGSFDINSRDMNDL